MVAALFFCLAEETGSSRRETRLPLPRRVSALLKHDVEESPDSMKTRCRVTPGGGNPRDSATEKRRPAHAQVTVKRCGKSAPRVWQQPRHGKPHREQCQIGTSRCEPGLLRPETVRVGS